MSLVFVLLTIAYRALQKESGQLESECSAVQKHITDLKKKMSSGPSLHDTIRRLETSVSKLENEVNRDRTGDRARLEKKVHKAVCDLAAQAARCADKALIAVDQPLKQTAPRVEANIFKNFYNDAKRTLQHMSEEFKELAEAVEAKEREYKMMKEALKKLKAEVCRITTVSNDDDCTGLNESSFCVENESCRHKG